MAPRLTTQIVGAGALALGAPATLYGLSVSTWGHGFDHTSPVPPRQQVIAIVGVAAVAVVAVVLATAVGTADRRTGVRLPSRPTLVAALVLAVAGLASAAPLRIRISTVDVTDAGFRQAAYSALRSSGFDPFVYNATTTPVVIRVGAAGGRVLETDVPARTRTALRWPKDSYGTFTLDVVGPLPPGARLSATVSVSRTQQTDPHWRPPTPPHQPPAPPMPPMPPLR